MSDLIALPSVASLPREQWNALLPENAGPFLQYDFLNALETTGCATPETGWQPSHLVALDDEGNAHQVIPAYIKQHSYGEYVFDWQWAEAYASYGMDYYPKLLLGIPFTPVPGPRVIGSSDPQTLASALAKFCEAQSLSGWHMNFPADNRFAGSDAMHDDTPERQPLPRGIQPSQRMGYQFIWRNQGYQSFDDFLATFVSRKRKSVLKERRRIAEQGLKVSRIIGSDITSEDIKRFYECYCDTYYRRRSHPYLSLAFFQLLRETMSDQMMMVVADDEEGRCAAALCFFDDSSLYGRYWGCLRDYDALHFEACYYQGIEFCIERGLTMFNPGTQGEHKISRGFAPEFTRSFHWLAHPEFHRAVSDFVQQEARYVEEYTREAATRLPFHR